MQMRKKTHVKQTADPIQLKFRGRTHFWLTWPDWLTEPHLRAVHTLIYHCGIHIHWSCLVVLIIYICVLVKSNTAWSCDTVGHKSRGKPMTVVRLHFRTGYWPPPPFICGVLMWNCSCVNILHACSLSNEYCAVVRHGESDILRMVSSCCADHTSKLALATELPWDVWMTL